MADSSTDSKASFAAISNGIVGSTVSTMDAVLTDANPDSYAIVMTMLGDHGRTTCRSIRNGVRVRPSAVAVCGVSQT